MNILNDYIKKLDNGFYDCEDVSKINEEFNEILNQLKKDGENKTASLADLDRQVFYVHKSFDYKDDPENGILNGLSWKYSGTKTLEDGSQTPFYWPDIKSLTQENFEFFEKRYNSIEKNLFIKTEYGLMVYFGQKTSMSKHNDFKRQLCEELFQLSKDYCDKNNKNKNSNHYVRHFFQSLRLSFGIAEKAKLTPELNKIIKYIFNIHQKWDITKEGTLRILLDLSGLLSDYFNLTNKIIDFKKVIDKNMKGAEELEKTYIHGALYAVDRNITIEKKRKKSIDYLLQYKAKLYEKLAIGAEKKSNRACISYAEDALRIYKQLKETAKITELEHYYNTVKRKFPLTQISQQIPDKIIQSIYLKIQEAIKQSNENEIIEYFITSPWFDSIQKIKEQSEKIKEQSILLSLLPTAILDKFGNKIDVFYTEEEKEKYNFWSSYAFNFQIGNFTMYNFFIEAYKAGKLKYDSVISYLENTWFNEVFIRKYHNEEVKIKPVDTLKPGIKKLFEEVGKISVNPDYKCDFVTITDSLTLKIEGLLRIFCGKIGIPTFKTIQKGSNKLIMEKILDDLLADIAHKPPLSPEQETNFDEEDRILMKFVLTEKSGLNLRNKVAHSLMDIYEYTLDNIVILFCIILKLSKYSFVEKK